MKQMLFALQHSRFYAQLSDWFIFRWLYLQLWVEDLLATVLPEQPTQLVGPTYVLPTEPRDTLIPFVAIHAKYVNNEWAIVKKVPEKVISEMKDVITQYSKARDDVIIIPESYLIHMGITESYFTDMDIKVIIFDGNTLLKPALVKTHGY